MRNEPHLLNYLHADLIEAGCDEAGRGPLAGPVFAAAVILPKDFHHPLLNDSKKMTEKSREILRPIIEREAIAWAVEEVSAEDIDTINILECRERALDLLGAYAVSKSCVSATAEIVARNEQYLKFLCSLAKFL